MEEKENNSLTRYDTVLAFLCLEALALTCFGFAGLTGLTILRAVGFCLSLFFIPFISNGLKLEQFNKKGKTFLILIGGLAILLSFSYFWIKMYEGNAFSMIIQNLMILIGFGGFFILGYGIRYLKVVKVKYVMFAFLGGLALLVFITLIYSLIRYGFLYSLLYRNKVYYFDGVVFSIANEGKYLDGFSFVEVSLSFAKTSSFILAASLLALPFAIKNKDKQEILALSICGGLGLIDLLVVPFRRGLIWLMLVYLLGAICYLIKYFSLRNKEKTSKIINIIYYVFIGLVSLMIFLLLIDGVLGFEKGFMHKLPLVGRYFKEGAMLGSVREAISSIMFETDVAEIRRFSFHSFMTFLFGSSKLTTYDLKIFEFTILFQNGFIAFALTIAIIFIFLKMGLNKLMEKETSASELSLWFALLGVFMYLSILNSELPFRHLSEIDNIFSPRSGNFVSITRSNIQLLIFFLLGFLCIDLTSPKEVVAKEPKKEQTKENVSKELKEVSINE